MKKINIECVNFEKLIIYYGPKLHYKIQFQWSKDKKAYDIVLGVSYDQKPTKNPFETKQINPHHLFINEVKKYFNKSQSVLNIVQLLNSTFMFAFALNKLINIPKLNSKVIINQSYVTFSSFMLIIYALNHVRLIFHSKYWVDVQITQQGQITLRDSCFDSVDNKKETEQINLIRFLTV